MGITMFVPITRWPGTWLEMADPGVSRDHELLFYVMDGGIQDAAVALQLFETAQRGPWPDPRESWELVSRLTREAHEQLQPSPTDPRNQGSYSDVAQAVEMQVLRETVRMGLVPAEYRNRANFVHAKSFLFSLDVVARAMKTAASLAGAPNEAVSIVSDWRLRFPDLTGVRDTSHHPDDRVRGLDRRSRPLESMGVYVENLSGSSLSSTMNDGTVGTVDVTRESLSAASSLVNSLLNSYTWKGLPHISPRP